MEFNKCGNCGREIDINEHDVVHAVHPITKNLQTICTPCDAKIPWKTIIDQKFNKPILYYGDLT